MLVLFLAIFFGCAFAAGYSHAAYRHAKFMADGWFMLGKIAEDRPLEFDDYVRAFGERDRIARGNHGIDP